MKPSDFEDGEQIVNAISDPLPLSDSSQPSNITFVTSTWRTDVAKVGELLYLWSLMTRQYSTFSTMIASLDPCINTPADVNHGNRTWTAKLCTSWNPSSLSNISLKFLWYNLNGLCFVFLYECDVLGLIIHYFSGREMSIRHTHFQFLHFATIASNNNPHSITKSVLMNAIFLSQELDNNLEQTPQSFDSLYYQRK